MSASRDNQTDSLERADVAKAALERIAKLGNRERLSLEEYVRRADEIAVDALIKLEGA